MKIRSDFVSNSSSCSFMVNDIKAFMAKLNELSRNTKDSAIDTWWLNDISISFYIENTAKNKMMFKPFLKYYSNNDYDKDIYVSGCLDMLFELDKEAYSSMKNISIYSYGEYRDNSIDKLVVLYMAMKASGIDIDCSRSEKKLNLLNNVPRLIVKTALNIE